MDDKTKLPQPTNSDENNANAHPSEQPTKANALQYKKAQPMKQNLSNTQIKSR